MTRIHGFYLLNIGIVAISLLLIIGDSVQNRKEVLPVPLPTETFILGKGEDPEYFLWKQQWMDAIHNSAPQDNWRQKDHQYILDRANELRDDQARNLPVAAYWKEVGSNNLAGRTLIAEYDHEEDNVYIASDGGQIWKGNIGMDNWSSLNDQIHFTGIHFLRKVPYLQGNRLMICSGNWNIIGFLYSDDDGATWTNADGLDNITNWGYIKRTVIKNDASHSIYLLSQEWDYSHWNAISRIYVSTDMGEHFSVIQTFDEPTFGGIDRFDLWTSYDGNGEVFLVENNHFDLINNQHEVIHVADIPMTQPGMIHLTGHESAQGNVYYITNWLDNVSEFYGSGTGGTGWTLRGYLDEGPFMRNSFSCSPLDPDVLYFGGVNCYASHDGGFSWDVVNWWWQYYGSPETQLHADIPGINPFLDAQGHEFDLINTDGGTYVSYDQLDNVQNLSLSNLRISQYYSTYTHRNHTHISHAGSQDQGYQKSIMNADTSVISYEQLISGDYGHLVSGDEGNSLWMVYPGFVMYNTNAVGNGQLVMWDFIGSGFYWMPYLMADPEDPKSVYLAGGSTTSGSHIYHLSYSAGSIIYEEQPFDFSQNGNGQISALACSPGDPNYRYTLTSNGGFFFSTDAGESWMQTEDFIGPGAHYFYGASIAVSTTNPGTVYIAGSGYSNDGAFISTDFGITFTPIVQDLPGTLIFELALNAAGDLLFAATELGPFVYKVEENRWFTLSDGVCPAQTYWSVDFIPALNSARFGTYGRGIWDLVLGDSPVVYFIVNHSSICQGDGINFTDLSQGDPIEWEWYFEGGDPEVSYDKNPQNIQYDLPGDWDVNLVVRNLFGADSILLNDLIHVKTIPEQPQTPIGPDSLVINSPDTEFTTFSVSGASSYQWQLSPEEAGTISGSDTVGLVNWSEAFTGDASIRVKAVNKCGESMFSDELLVAVFLNVGLDGTQLGDYCQIFQNPASDVIWIRFPESLIGNGWIELYDIQGQRLISGKWNGGRDMMKLDVNGYVQGIYLLVVGIGDKVQVEKVIL